MPSYTDEIKWLGVMAYMENGTTMVEIQRILKCSPRSIRRWYSHFEQHGCVSKAKKAKMNSSLMNDDKLHQFIVVILSRNPGLYLKEIQERILDEASLEISKISLPTICRIIKHKLGYSRLVMEKHSRLASFSSQLDFLKLVEMMCYKDVSQLVFVDEVSKDASSLFRKRGRGKKNEKLVSTASYERGSRVSAVAAADVTGFCGWGLTTNTYTSDLFFEHFKKYILPNLNPWPYPRSILILDNAKIHQQEIIELCFIRGVICLFLPPYSPKLNPIEIYFGLFKAYLQKHIPMDFYKTLPVHFINEAFKNSVNMKIIDTHAIFRHCCYEKNSINFENLKIISKFEYEREYNINNNNVSSTNASNTNANTNNDESSTCDENDRIQIGGSFYLDLDNNICTTEYEDADEDTCYEDADDDSFGVNNIESDCSVSDFIFSD